MSTFTWTTYDWGTKSDEKPTIRSTAFGDGYEWRQGIGINPIVEKWDLTFSLRPLDEGNAILDFLRATGGVDSFDWTNPDGVTGKYKCQEWPHTIENFNVMNINVTFQKVYEP